MVCIDSRSSVELTRLISDNILVVFGFVSWLGFLFNTNTLHRAKRTLEIIMCSDSGEGCGRWCSYCYYPYPSIVLISRVKHVVVVWNRSHCSIMMSKSLVTVFSAHIEWLSMSTKYVTYLFDLLSDTSFLQNVWYLRNSFLVYVYYFHML